MSGFRVTANTAVEFNMISPLVVILAFAALLGMDKKRQGPTGHIVNISSTACAQNRIHEILLK
jgi:hypothetical protein